MCRFSLFLITVEVLTAHKEEVEGTETHEMGNLGPHTGSVASPLRSVSTGQDINDEAHPVVSQSQAEGSTSIWPRCRIPRRLFCSVTGPGVGSGAPETNITSDKLTQGEAQSRAYFLTIVEISMT